MDFVQQVARYIAAEGLLSPQTRVIVGLSGGADSVALLSVLKALGYDAVAVHCHFGLRPDEAERDLKHSRAIAQSLGCQFVDVRFDTRGYMAQKGISAEMACRELRYDKFEQLRQQLGAEAIAVGHHRQDNVETFFLNLLRGSGIHGLRAMLPKRGNIIRPLLGCSRRDIQEYLDSQGIDYVIDSSNFSNDYKRNKIRNVILPLLEAEFPGSSEAIERSIANLRGNEQLYNELLPPRCDSLEGISPTLLHEWLAPYGFNSDQCMSILNAAPGAVFKSQSHCLTIYSDGKTLYKVNKYALEPLGAECLKPKLKGKIIDRFERFEPRPGKLYLDADAVGENGNWEFRPWQPGDRIRPFGMKGTKLVSDLLAQAGIPASHRYRHYVLCLNGQILWVVGIRASALFPITSNTKRIIEIEVTESLKIELP